MRTAELRERLRRRVLGPEGQGARSILLEEVPVRLPGEGERRVDAVSVGLWKSRGYLIEAYEIKATRTDWLRELREPEKAEAVGRFADRFWLVSPLGTVRPGELPANWGWMVPENSGLRVEREPVRLSPEPPSPQLIASMLRVAVKADVRRETKLAREAMREQMEARVRRELASAEGEASRWRTQYELLREALDEFERVTGTTFSSLTERLDVRRLASVVSALYDLGPPHPGPDPAVLLRRALGATDRRREAIASALAEMDENVPGVGRDV